MILQEFTPDQICKQLGFCPSSKQAPSSIRAISQPTEQVVKKKISDSECDMCVSVVQFVYSELKDNATEEEIKLLLDKACSLFPGETRQKCVNMVNTYFDMLVSLLTPS
uniref:Putative prosaposin n=1 Tax=Ixodes ricinus TaxID=34613 RepID=A0A0K8RDA8_IXORI